jgi:hypothetical protein
LKKKFLSGGKSLMADNFGLKIGMEVEAAFKNSLREINQAFKVLGSEMQLVTAPVEGISNAAQVNTLSGYLISAARIFICCDTIDG